MNCPNSCVVDYYARVYILLVLAKTNILFTVHVFKFSPTVLWNLTNRTPIAKKSFSKGRTGLSIFK